MGFCARCGAPTSESMSFCTSCGESLAKAVYPPPGAPFAPAPPHAGSQVASGPPGTTREPWIVLLLSFVTLGIYTIVFWWQTSKELDAFAGKPGHSHKLVRLGTFLMLGATALAIFFLVSVLGTVIGMGGETPSDAAVVSAILGAIGTFLLLVTLGVAAGIVLLIGRYKAWELIEQEQRRRGEPNPLSAGLMLALSIGAWFVPFVGFALRFVVLYMTQENMNRLWARQPGLTWP